MSCLSFFFTFLSSYFNCVFFFFFLLLLLLLCRRRAHCRNKRAGWNRFVDPEVEDTGCFLLLLLLLLFWGFFINWTQMSRSTPMNRRLRQKQFRCHLLNYELWLIWWVFLSGLWNVFCFPFWKKKGKKKSHVNVCFDTSSNELMCCKWLFDDS